MVATGPGIKPKKDKMKLKELKEKASKLGIKPGVGMKKEGLIRAIQVAEGNSPCFGTAKDCCTQLICCFRDDCVPKQADLSS